jgi:predicted Rossmann fold nucleotide-binding protein DprA/Smf involved in DNA uptake
MQDGLMELLSRAAFIASRITAIEAELIELRDEREQVYARLTDALVNRRAKSKSARILDFMTAHADRTFAPREIAKELDLEASEVSAYLGGFAKRGRVRKIGTGAYLAEVNGYENSESPTALTIRDS